MMREQKCGRGLTSRIAISTRSSKCTAYRRLERAERPDLAAMFHEFIAHRLSERVAETGRLVDTLIG